MPHNKLDVETDIDREEGEETTSTPALPTATSQAPTTPASQLNKAANEVEQQQQHEQLRQRQQQQKLQRSTTTTPQQQQNKEKRKYKKKSPKKKEIQNNCEKEKKYAN